MMCFLYAVFFQFLFFVANFTLWFLSDITVNSVPSEEVHYWSIDDVSAADPSLGPSSSTHCNIGSTALYTDLRIELRTRFSSSYHFLVVKQLGLLGLKWPHSVTRSAQQLHQFWRWFDGVLGALNLKIAGSGCRWSAVSSLSFVISTIAGAGWHVFNTGRVCSILEGFFVFFVMKEMTTVS